jgi:hypothetical protein
MVSRACLTGKVNVMKEQTSHTTMESDQPGRMGKRPERGAVLLVVIVLSAIVLAVMTTLIYMIMVGTQISGIEKRYRTAHDAAFGGWAVIGQLLATRGSNANVNIFKANLAGLSPTVTDDAGCTGTTDDGNLKSGIAAKMLTRSTTWSAPCGSSLTIDPKTASTADFTMKLGSGTTYNVYGKIANTFSGNTAGGGGSDLRGKGVVASASGEIAVMPMPYLYTIEIDAENANNPSERAKLSILYQY